MKNRWRILQRMKPANYQLGMWRVQYFKKNCCACNLNPSLSSHKLPHNHSNNRRKKEHLSPKRSFFSSILCHYCHKDIKWLPATLLKPLHVTSHITRDITNNIKGYEALELTFDLSIQSAAPHTGVIRDSLIHFKYRENVNSLPILVHAINQLPRPNGCYEANSVILPMPTTNGRLKKRGFDPVAVLAHYLSLHWGIPIWQGAHRIDDVRSQKGLDRFERQRNIGNAFSIVSPPPTKNVILFDDVVTTGATLTALATTLKSAYPEATISAYSVTHGH